MSLARGGPERMVKIPNGEVSCSDVLITTWANIGKFLGMSERSARRRRARLVDGGYAFTLKLSRGRKPVYCAWFSSLKRYVEDCGRDGIVC